MRGTYGKVRCLFLHASLLGMFLHGLEERGDELDKDDIQ